MYEKSEAKMSNAIGGAGQRNPAAPTPNDPACLRSQYQGLCALADRLAGQRNYLRDIADSILGPEPEDGAMQAGIAGNSAPVGGTFAEIVGAFEGIANIVNGIDHEISRLQRVSA